MPYEAFADRLAWWGNRVVNERAWRVPAAEILANNCNLDRKNPNAAQDLEHLPPEQLVVSILEKEQRIAALMVEIGGDQGDAGGTDVKVGS
jgi:type I restriction enzyme M protein